MGKLKTKSHSHDLIWIPAISPWTPVSFPDHLQVVQWAEISIREAAELVHPDVPFGVPPGLMPRSCVRIAQSDLYLLAGYNAKEVIRATVILPLIDRNSHLLDKYMANEGHVQRWVMTFFVLVSGSGLSALRAISRNESGMLIFRARCRTRKAPRSSLNSH
jgi:hypothetical protein